MLSTYESSSFFGRKKIWRIVVIAFLFAAALGIRVYDLNNPPFDFHPTRQLFTAIVARGEYYQNLTTAPQWMRDRAVAQWKIEDTDFPTIDILAAWTYRLIGHEDLFFPRLYSALFWILGGLAVFLLSREMTSIDGAIVATGFYLLTPYGIIASRSFQPDPLMTCLILFSWWAMYRWFNTGKWKWAILAGVLAGASLLTKALSAFSLLGGMAGVFFARDLRKSIRDIKFWIMGILAATPFLVWYVISVISIKGKLGAQFWGRFIPSLLISPVYYLRLEGMAERVVGLIPLVLAMLGFFLIAERGKRTFLAGLWGGYVFFALVFNWNFMTHDYYHLSLVPIVALSLAPLGDLASRQLVALNPGRLARVGIVLVLLLGIGSNLWNVRQTFHKADYRPRAAMLAHIGELLDHGSSAIALTGDYNYSLSYYGWVAASYWPQTGDDALRQLAGMDTPAFRQQFNNMTAGKQYFVVTDLAELDNQPDLKTFLAANYPVFEKGDGYIIYDLLHPNAVP